MFVGRRLPRLSRASEVVSMIEFFNDLSARGQLLQSSAATALCAITYILQAYSVDEHAFSNYPLKEYVLANLKNADAGEKEQSQVTGASNAAQSFEPAQNCGFEARCKYESSRESEIVTESAPTLSLPLGLK